MEIFLIRLLQFMLAISLLVLLHEGGHFFFAKLFGIWVEKFYLFFDPSIWKWDGSLFQVQAQEERHAVRHGMAAAGRLLQDCRHD